jgi:hypothetical protein
LDVAAAGVQVWSTWLNGNYALLDGTSMASPHITGAVALIQAKAMIRYGKKLTPDQVKMLLQIDSEDLGDKGPDELYGFGVFSFGRFDQSERIPNKLKMTIGSTQCQVNGQLKQMEVAPFLQNDHAFVPVRFISEELGGKVDWIQDNQEIDIEL